MIAWQLDDEKIEAGRWSRRGGFRWPLGATRASRMGAGRSGRVWGRRGIKDGTRVGRGTQHTNEQNKKLRNLSFGHKIRI